MRFLHTNIVARNWRWVSQFYQRVFGCYPLDPRRNYEGTWISAVVGMEGVQIEGEHLACPGYDETGLTLEIFSYRPEGAAGPLAVNDRGFAHICFEVEDIPATLARILQEGGSILSTFTHPEQERCVYTRDPEGNIVEIRLPRKERDTYRPLPCDFTS